MSRRILVVDDQESILFFLRKTLEQEGYEVIGAASSREAHEQLAESIPDVVLLDLKLPDGSGLTILEELQRDEPDLAVVMMTAFGDVDTSVRAMKLGAFDYVNKPIRLEELLGILDRAMARALERHRTRLGAAVRELQAVSPLAVLGRGYAILEDDAGQVIRRAADTRPGQPLTARLGDGRLKVEVKRRFNR